MSVQALSWVLEYSQSKHGARLTLLSIANHARHDGSGAWPSVDTIARESRLTAREVQLAIRKLEKLGELRVERGAGPRGTHLYSLSKMGGENSSGVKSFHPENSARKGVKSSALSMRKFSPEPSLSRPVNRPSVPNSDLSRSPQAAEDWKKISSELRQKIDPHSWECWVRPLRGRGVDRKSLVVEVPNGEFSLWVQEHWTGQVIEAAKKVGLSYRGVEFCEPISGTRGLRGLGNIPLVTPAVGVTVARGAL